MPTGLPHRAAFALAIALPLLAACHPSIKTATKTPSAPPGRQDSAPAPARVAPPVEDPVLSLIAESDRRFTAGQAALAAGHLEAARQEFDRAIGVLIESPYGGRTEPRIREQYDRLVDRISTYELKALAQGDGFAEKPSTTATIDELLALSATLAAPPNEPEPARTEAPTDDAGASVGALEIPLNPRVQFFVDQFQGRLRGFLEDGLRRGNQYLPMIQDALKAKGLPTDLAFIPLVESAFKTSALSRAKARGIWQFMRGTAGEHGLRQDWYVDERSDPEKATHAAAQFLDTLYKMFDGDWNMVLASYNGGPGRMQRAAKRAKSDDFWTIAAAPKLLPRETRDYVPMVLAAIIVAREPERFGFEIEPGPAPVVAFEILSIDKPVDLRRVAEWADTSIDTIQTLNPALRRWTTPIGEEPFLLKVPIGSADVVRVRLEAATAAESSSLNWYVVKKGDTLTAVARRLRVSRADLAEANFLKTTAPLAPGRKLVIPREPTPLVAGATPTPEPRPPAPARRLTPSRTTRPLGQPARPK